MKRELYLWLAIGALMWAWALAARGVTLQWDAPADASVTGYRVWWGTASGLHGDSSDAGPETTKTLSDDIFLPGVTYYFVARSYNTAGIESSNSNEVEWMRPPAPTPTPFPTPSPTPSPPQNLRFTLVVLNGSGDGEYEAGTLVLVIADKAPQRYAFSRWGGDWIILANPYLKRTTATIPYRDVSIEALYEPR